MIFDLPCSARPSYPLEGVAPCGVRECLGSNRVPPQGLAAGTRMKNADLLDVAACVA
jgi:hypothetical protein